MTRPTISSDTLDGVEDNGKPWCTGVDFVKNIYTKVEGKKNNYDTPHKIVSPLAVQVYVSVK